MKSEFYAILRDLRSVLGQKKELIMYPKCKKARLAQLGYMRDMMDNMATITDQFDRTVTSAQLMIKLVDSLEMRVQSQN